MAGTLSLWFPIVPGAKQSFRYNKFGHKFKDAKVKQQEHTIKSLLINQLPFNFKPIQKAVKVYYEFRFPYPKTISKKLKGLEQLFRSKRPDMDNLQKSINDALNQSVFVDDSQIVEIHAVKVYSEKPGIYISLKEVDNFS